MYDLLKRESVVILQSRVGKVASKTGGSFTNQRDNSRPHADYPPVTEWLQSVFDMDKFFNESRSGAGEPVASLTAQGISLAITCWQP
jgi:hypothetical protein